MNLIRIACCFLMMAGCCAYGQRRTLTAPDASQQPPLASSEGEKRILAILEQARASGDVFYEVPLVDGRMLRILTETANAKQVVEFGTSTGYSGMWFALALQKTGGKLVTFEMDKERATQARKHFEQAGVSGLVQLIEGDAHQNLSQVKGLVDVVFIDAEKEGYVSYLKSMLPLVRPGGLILGHNINMVPDYVTAITTDPNLETVFFMHGGGLSITVKKH